MPAKKSSVNSPAKKTAKTKPVRAKIKTKAKKTNAIAKLKSILFAMFLLVVITAALAALAHLYLNQSLPHRQTALSDEQYYFTDSRYKGIHSKFVTRDTSSEKVSIEYPITKNDKINRTIAKAIDAADSDFRYTATNTSTFDQPRPMTETISYQITHSNQTALSIIVNIKQDLHGVHPVALTRFWTFDKQSGNIIKLSDLTARSNEAISTIITTAKHSVTETLRHRQQTIPDLDDTVTSEALSNFIITDNSNTLAWPFGQSVLLPSSYGEITAKVPIAAIAKYLQNPLAKKLANIPKPAAPKPPTPAAPAYGKVIALTFDDGPGAYTAQLLDILDQHKAKATFFLIGSKASAQADVLRRMHKRGHQLGNHSWSHPELPKLPVEQIASEIDRTNDAIKQASGVKPTAMRPPYGAVNSVVMEQLRLRGMSSVLWSVDTRDWADRNSDIVCSRAVAGAHPGAIILMHDIHQTSVEAVPCILSALKQQGYSFVTVQTMLGTMTPGVGYP